MLVVGFTKPCSYALMAISKILGKVIYKHQVQEIMLLAVILRIFLQALYNIQTTSAGVQML